MDPPSPTRICSNAALQEQTRCPSVAVAAFYDAMGRQIWLGNTLLLVSAAITGVMVGIGGYGRRYRHHRFTRFIFLGANTLFLPIISYVVSTLGDNSNDYVHLHKDSTTTLSALCDSVFHPCMIITWAFLVQIAAINTTSVVAIDSREGSKLRPPPELLLRGIWIFYLSVSITKNRFFHGLFRFSPNDNHGPLTLICSKIMFTPFALLCAKIWLKCYSFEKARKSFALGRNPSLVFGYMQQLQQQERSQYGGPVAGEDSVPPPLLVMGEDSRKVEKQPWGHVFSDSWAPPIDSIGLVTLDTVWQLDKMLPTSTPRPKDLCLSFALFKLLRCRFARYDLTNVGSRGLKFYWNLLLKDGEHDRVFRIVADELSFLNDYYYSSLAVSYAKCWLPVLSILISLLSIGYCIVAGYFIVVFGAQVHKQGRSQIYCEFWCNKLQAVSEWRHKRFGSLYFDVVPEFVLLVLVLIAEVREVSSYICSNWTKVALICECVKSATLQHPLGMQKWIVSLLMQCRWKIINHWDEKIGMCSVLVLPPTSRTTLLGLIRRLFHLPDEKRKVKLPAAVKVCIMDVLQSAARSNGFHLGNGKTSLLRSQVGKSFLWACNSKGTSDIILTWHIATSILEVRHPYSSPVSNQHKIAATHLSRYCAYLMTWSPDLLPDEVAWSKGLYEDVKRDAVRVIAGRSMAGRPLTPEAEYQDLVKLLSEGSNHLVLKNGVWLGKQFAELAEGEETAWAILAGFWAEMILYVAPSDNLKGHKKAIARGGELITLLWALLFHAGIVSRPGETGGAATAGFV
ncbi:hypothetical protein SEVIR_2G030900v4 [Setaria viridis]|uniref:DUF4220 domain-containing protein n=1 Tax=Setaria viridis TaxID=4556 RepID=A0A4U6VZ74_SETVI|nr:uncharacterized protein LOC117842939 [Setaria viridis]TKW30357.1 hypothetical protein SEVIR_2G030900v2 [Setaria viridis]